MIVQNVKLTSASASSPALGRSASQRPNVIPDFSTKKDKVAFGVDVPKSVINVDERLASWSPEARETLKRLINRAKGGLKAFIEDENSRGTRRFSKDAAERDAEMRAEANILAR
ncbi:MAG: hypothetical protein PHC64_00995 [Candidatus Gastranaerophilales bacterium]|nr:hypothetical protein [Candidatus Gastranaerophilales bacterium]